MVAATVEDGIRRKFERLLPSMNERVRRHWAAAEAMALGHGGVAAVARATGMSRNTVRAGIGELDESGDAGDPLPPSRVRRPGGGGKPLAAADPGLPAALEALVAPDARGDPVSPLRWTLKSTARLSAELARQGHRASARTVAALLKAAGYSLQGNRKTKEGGTHPDRDAQFRHIAARAAAVQARGQPLVSVDAKKKEPVGEFRNGGREWRPRGEPEEVKVYDFVDPAPDKGRVTPYGVYDPAADEAWVSVGVDHDTAAFAAGTIKKWWDEMGRRRYPAATELMVTADGGGSNSSRGPAVEGRVATAGRRDRADAPRQPLPAGDQQVEQDRAPAVLPRHAELAGAAAGQPRRDRQPDRGDDHGQGAAGAGGAGRGRLPERGQSQ